MSTNYSNIDTTTVGYRDLDLQFKLHPQYGDIRPVTDINAIKNSIKNIIYTRRGESPFNPSFGSNVFNYLFENATDTTKYLLGQEIEYSIEENEPRVKLTKITVSDNRDANAYVIRLDMLIVNTQEEVDITLNLKRLR